MNWLISRFRDCDEKPVGILDDIAGAPSRFRGPDTADSPFRFYSPTRRRFLEGSAVPSNPLPSVVACGAYERDNLGDLLFLIVSDHFARGVIDVDFAAPMPTDMTDLLNREIPAAGALLSERPYRGIWTVGGEVGATSRDYVYRTAVDAEEWERFSALDAKSQDAEMNEAMRARMESPYVPRPSAFPRNHGARLVLNSVGVSGIAGLPAWRAAVATSALREASFISVRDQKSADLLDRLEIPHRLAPDLVHTIAAVVPSTAPRGETVLLQLSEAHIGKYDLQVWVDALVDCVELGDHPVRLFVAGSAPAHDSVDLYRDLIAGVRAQRPDWDIALSEGVSVEDRVREIASAALWIGSSLHGRIIACAYGTKRVSIEKPKVDAYAETWDADFPFAVEPSTLAQAITTALGQQHDLTHATALAEKATQSVVAALAVLIGDEAPTAADPLLLRVDEVAELQVAAMSMERTQTDAVEKNRAQAVEIIRLAGDRAEQRQARQRADSELEGLRARLAEIEKSTSWKLGTRLVSVARAVRVPRAIRDIVRRNPR